jgi:hypothetical protein
MDVRVANNLECWLEVDVGGGGGINSTLDFPVAKLPKVVQLKHATREEKDCLVTMAKQVGGDGREH